MPFACDRVCLGFAVYTETARIVSSRVAPDSDVRHVLICESRIHVLPAKKMPGTDFSIFPKRYGNNFRAVAICDLAFVRSSRKTARVRGNRATRDASARA